MLDRMRKCDYLPYDGERMDGLVRLDEDVFDPIGFSSNIERLLAHQTVVIVSCENTPVIPFSMGYTSQYFAIKPEAIVNVSSESSSFPSRRRLDVLVESDSSETFPSNFREFFNRHRIRDWSIPAYPIRRSDAPIFLE